MQTLRTYLRWDLTFLTRYQIVAAAFGVGALYLLLFFLVPAIRIDELILALIYLDPTMLGMTFVGALILFEKSDNTLSAIAVTPIKPWHYLLSKALSLTFVMLPVAILMAGFGHGWRFNYPLFISNLILTSLVYAFLGIIVVARAQSMNEYIIQLALVTLPLSLPFLPLFGVWEHSLWYLIPSQASISLFQGAFGPIPTWEIFYGFGYLLILLPISYFFARRAYLRHLRG